jgi:hypothetical protein
MAEDPKTFWGKLAAITAFLTAVVGFVKLCSAFEPLSQPSPNPPVVQAQLDNPKPSDPRWTEFEVRQYKWYKHPEREYEMVLDNFNLHVSGFEGADFNVKGMPEGQWVQLTNGKSGRKLPVATKRSAERLFARWLP